MELNIGEEEIISLYKDGKTLNELSNLAGCKSCGPIKRILSANNIRLRKKGELRPNGKHKINLEYFKNIDSSEKAYWLGFICADGCIYKNGYKTSIVVKDKELLSRFKTAIGSDHPIGFDSYHDDRTDKTYSRYSLQLTSKHFTRHIVNNGITSNKSNECYFPNISEELYFDYIRGLFDGDGYVGKETEGIRTSLISTKEQLEFIQEYLSKLGMKKTSILRITDKKPNVYKLIMYSDSHRFLELIYKNSTAETRLERKYIRFLNRRGKCEKSTKQ